MTLAQSTVQRERDKFVETGTGETAIRTSTEELESYAVQVAVDSGDSNITYIGKAEPGTATSASSWQIMKIDETSGTEVTFEDGDDTFDNKWSERESGSYS